MNNGLDRPELAATLRNLREQAGLSGLRPPPETDPREAYNTRWSGIYHPGTGADDEYTTSGDCWCHAIVIRRRYRLHDAAARVLFRASGRVTLEEVLQLSAQIEELRRNGGIRPLIELVPGNLDTVYMARDPVSREDKNSDIGGCETVYELLDAPADPECVVQGQVISNSHLENVLPGEGAVRIKREVLVAAVRRLEDDECGRP